MKNVIFIVGGPGSGKDILVRQITEQFSIPEYTVEQLNSKLKKNIFLDNFVVNSNAYYLDKIIYSKRLLEDRNYNISMIYVDVDDYTSIIRMASRTNINEESRKNKFDISKHNKDILQNAFEGFFVFDNNLDITEQIFEEVNNFVLDKFNPIDSLLEKKTKNIKDYIYKKFMSDKDPDKNKPKSWFSQSAIRPDGYNDYDIRNSGQSNVIHYGEDVGSPEEMSSLTGMSFQNKEDNPTLDRVIIEPSKKKPKFSPKFNSPAKPNNEGRVWHQAKSIISECESVKKYKNTSKVKRK